MAMPGTQSVAVNFGWSASKSQCRTQMPSILFRNFIQIRPRHLLRLKVLIQVGRTIIAQSGPGLRLK
jgi:hypothetical protein